MLGWTTVGRSLWQRSAPGLAHLRNLNAHVTASLTGGILRPARQAGPVVDPGLSARVGVSAFSFMGTNAHLVLRGPGGNDGEDEEQEEHDLISPLITRAIIYDRQTLRVIQPRMAVLDRVRLPIHYPTGTARGMKKGILLLER